MASVLAFDTRPKELSETEALEWLRAQPRGSAPANSAVLAERWGWSRQRVTRCLRTWQAAGLITRTGNVLTVGAGDEPAPRAMPPVVAAAMTAVAIADPPAALPVPANVAPTAIAPTT